MFGLMIQSSSTHEEIQALAEKARKNEVCKRVEIGQS